jgi:hypothetical protein
MGTITAGAVIDKAEIVIQDTTNIRWPQTELLGWLNDGQREVVLHKPSASVINASVALTVGVTKQTIPAAGVQLIDVVRNMGSAGSTPGPAIRIVSREILDSQVPTWHADANASGDIKHYMFDPRDPKTFYVYPKAPATAWFVELVYASSPVDCATISSTIALDDIYANALMNYVLFRAYSKDSTFAQNATLASAAYQLFMTAVTGKAVRESENNPNLSTAPFNPNVLGSAKI